MEKNKPEYRENVKCPECGGPAVALTDGIHCMVWCQEGHASHGDAVILTMTPEQVKVLKEKEKKKDSLAEMLESILGVCPEEEMLAPPEETEKYLAGHQASGLKVGDQVTVLSKAQTKELGWCNDWTPPMDKLVGNTYTICKDHGKYGFQIENPEKNFCLPYFILEKEVAK